jgi:ATP-dependent helicase HrpB
VLRAAEQLYRLVDIDLAPRAADPATALMRSLLEAFPDRLAKLRPGANDRATMVGGRGLRLDGGSRVRQEPLILAIDLDDGGGEARVRQASAIDREWLEDAGLRANLRSGEELLYSPSRRQVEARRRTAWLDLVLDETPVAINDASAAAALLAGVARQEAAQSLPDPDSAAGRFRLRVDWLARTMPDLDLPTFDDASLLAMLPGICRGLRSLDEVRAADWLSRLQEAVGWERLALVDRLAPAEIALASGRRYRLEYRSDGPPVLSARIQELFGTLQTPRVADGRVPVVVHLLGPNHRPQQVTADLESFWRTTYHDIRKELKRRYPKHPWPDDPLQALPPQPRPRT